MLRAGRVGSIGSLRFSEHYDSGFLEIIGREPVAEPGPTAAFVERLCAAQAQDTAHAADGGAVADGSSCDQQISGDRVARRPARSVFLRRIQSLRADRQ